LSKPLSGVPGDDRNGTYECASAAMDPDEAFTA